jgi:hypothetical protein
MSSIHPANANMAEITTREHFAAVIAHLSQAGYAFKLPLYRAAQAGMGFHAQTLEIFDAVGLCCSG